MREPAPPYLGEEAHALWHASDDPAIEAFLPHRSATAASDELLVWAIDTRHQPFFWFPRDCPRGTFWVQATTSAGDRERFLGAGAERVHAIQSDWWDRFRSGRIYLYRLPKAGFLPHPEVGGYWISREPVEPLEVVELDGLPQRHVSAGIELRVVPDLLALWETVIASTLEFSGIRLRNL